MQGFRKGDVMRRWLVVWMVWPGVAFADVPYRATDDGRYELTRALTFETQAFGTVRLTKGYRSDGSTSPIPDSEATRLAGFLHDALYAASGHLRFPDGAPKRYSKAKVDAVYCRQMRALGAGARQCAGELLGGADAAIHGAIVDAPDAQATRAMAAMGTQWLGSLSALDVAPGAGHRCGPG